MNLTELYQRNRSMPNGGARLLVSKVENSWKVSDGFWMYGDFPSKKAIHKALKQAGFISHLSCKTVYWHTY